MKGFRNGKRVILIALLLALAGNLGSSMASETGNTVQYAVRAVLPENQRNAEVYYFDLDMEPGQEQMLEVIVKNKGNEAIEVSVEANTAFSNSNGVIEYTASDGRDDSMAIDFAQIVTPVNSVIEVPANSQAIAEFWVRMPEEAFEGVVHGGFMFTKLHQGEDVEAKGGMAIRNVYRYVIGVRLYTSEDEVIPDFELTGAEMDLTQLPALVLHLRNPKSVIARGIKLRAEIYPQGSDTAVLTELRENLAIAPNSSMPYHLYLTDASLDSGSYLVKVWLEFEGLQWEFETPLFVD